MEMHKMFCIFLKYFLLISLHFAGDDDSLSAVALERDTEGFEG